MKNKEKEISLSRYFRNCKKALEKGHRPTKYFFNSLATTQTNSLITEMQIGNTLVNDQEAIEEHVAETYTKILNPIQ